MITSVDEKELLAWMGTKSDTRENAADVKKEMEKQKGHLLEALAAKGDALIKSKHLFTIIYKGNIAELLFSDLSVLLKKSILEKCADRSIKTPNHVKLN